MNFPPIPNRPAPIPHTLRGAVLEGARHEVGHMIAAKSVGFQTGPITLEVTDIRGGYRGGAEINMPRPLRTTAETMEYLSDRVVVLWAGALAEAFIGKKSDLETKLKAACECLNNGGGIHDHAKARELINLLRNLRFPDKKTEVEHQKELNAIEQEVWSRAINIVQAKEELISEIAAKLARMVKFTATKYTLSAEDIAAMTDEADICIREPAPEMQEQEGVTK
jgi:hypothetical protein